MKYKIGSDIGFWSRTSKNYDENIHPIARETNELIKSELKKDLTECRYLLELGCGTGIFTETLIGIADNLVATDLSDDMLVVAITKFGNYENVSFSSEDCHFLSFYDSTFDCVFIGNTLHVLSQPDKCLKEIWRVLKPGGRLIVASYSKQKSIKAIFRTIWNFARYGIPTALRNVTLDDMRKWVERSGFSIFKSKNIQGTPDELKAIYIGGDKE